MQLPELLRALRHLGLGGIATSLEARLVQAQADHSAYADFLALLLQDELTRRERMTKLAAVPFLIIDDLGMRKLPATAAEDLLELIMRRYERVSTLLSSNRPVEDWGKLLGDVAAVGALLIASSTTPTCSAAGRAAGA